MLRKIHVNDLSVGMYVEKIDRSWMEHDLAFASKRKIRSENELQKFKSSNIEEVYINTEKGLDFGIDGSESAHNKLLKRMYSGSPEIKAPENESRQEPSDFKTELEYAKNIYGESIHFLKKFVNSCQSGKIISYNEAEPIINNIVASITRNKNALFTIVNLSQFDKYTYTHSLDVAIITVALARQIGVPETDLTNLGLGALFHDIGKSKIPPKILNKPGKLTPAEFEVMKRHPLEGYKLIENQNGVPQEILRIILEHHEKYNGAGYPLGLGGDEINQFANLVSVADIYDALTTDRVYRKGMHPYKALQILFSEKEDGFYPGYAESLVKCLGIYPVGSLVKLSTGDYGRVIEACDDDPLAPKIRLYLDESMQLREMTLIDLTIEKDVSIVECLSPDAFPPNVRNIILNPK